MKNIPIALVEALFAKNFFTKAGRSTLREALAGVSLPGTFEQGLGDIEAALANHARLSAVRWFQVALCLPVALSDDRIWASLKPVHAAKLAYGLDKLVEPFRLFSEFSAWVFCGSLSVIDARRAVQIFRQHIEARTLLFPGLYSRGHLTGVFADRISGVVPLLLPQIVQLHGNVKFCLADVFETGFRADHAKTDHGSHKV